MQFSMYCWCTFAPMLNLLIIYPPPLLLLLPFSLFTLKFNKYTSILLPLAFPPLLLLLCVFCLVPALLIESNLICNQLTFLFSGLPSNLFVYMYTDEKPTIRAVHILYWLSHSIRFFFVFERNRVEERKRGWCVRLCKYINFCIIASVRHSIIFFFIQWVNCRDRA